MDEAEFSQDRCQTCRYWAGRCCHALARLEHDNEHPASCHHFTAEAPRILGGEAAAAAC